MSIFKNEQPQLVVITRPDFYEEEVAQITALLGADANFLLHLRKPGATVHQYRSILSQLPEGLLERITLGDHFELADEFPVGGVHLSSRQNCYVGKRKLRISKSCHSLGELKDIDGFTYVFFSPIFNSISKQGYNAAFSAETLLEASAEGLINEKVVALGGIDANTLPLLEPYAFGGAAVLGTVWFPFNLENFKEITRYF